MIHAAVVALCVLGLAEPTPTPEQAEWVKSNAIPVKTWKAGSGFDDLQPLKAVIGDARIVSLGEPTHGTREAFEFKHRLMEFLASEMGFTIFSIEASTPESYLIDPWVMGEDAQSDPADLVAGMGFWTWRTEEVLAMVRWMRDFNVAEKAAGRERRVRFTGFDMQNPRAAAEVVTDYLRKVDGDLYEAVRAKYARAARFDPNKRGGGATGGFGVATGTFPVDAARGKTVVFSGWIRTREVSGFAGLWWRCDRKGGKPGPFDNMGNRGPKGTTEWARYEVKIDVPEDTENINFGVLMPGTGQAWFDDLRIEIDGNEYSEPEELCLDFESGELTGFVAMAPGYLVTHDGDAPHGGTKALKIASIAPEPDPEPEADAVDAREAIKLSREALEAIKGRRGDLAAKSSAAEADWAIHNARIVWQGRRMFSQLSGRGFTIRDESMADNVEWILEQNPGAKIVLWAHNGHVNRREGTMGAFLQEKFPGREMVVFGFATGEGEYTAVAGKGGLRSDLKLATAPEGSVEAILGGSGVEGGNFVLDVREAREGEAGSGWARSPRPMRSIGALEQKAQFFPVVAAEMYDVLVYQHRTTAAVQIGKGK